MKHSFSFILLLIGCCCFAQPSDHDQEIMQIKGKWVRHNDVNAHHDALSTKNHSAFAIKKIDSIAYLLKQACPNPAGIEAAWYGTINEEPLFNGAPGSYSLYSLYQSYYFNRKMNKISLGSETGTWIYAYVNDFGKFLIDLGEWIIDGKPTKVFTLPESDGEWKGLPLYKTEYWGVSTSLGRYKDKAVLITRNGKLPYIPVTQKQFLLALKDKWLSLKQKSSDSQKLNEYYNHKIKIIDQYLSTHSDQQMKVPASTISTEDFIGHFGPDGKQTVYNPVRIDPSNFDDHLPRYIPRFVVLYWRCDKNTAAVEFIKQFEENFPVEKLKAMIDK